MLNKKINNLLKKIFIIDDDYISKFVNKKLIEKSGLFNEIAEYDSGRSALQLLQNPELNHETIPDLIFLDIQMPDMNGFEFLNEFEKLPNYITNKTKIVMLSSSLDDRDRDVSLKNNFVIDFISKPLDNEKLTNIVFN